MATIVAAREQADTARWTAPDSWSWWLADRIASEPDPRRALERAASAAIRQLGLARICFATVAADGPAIVPMLDRVAAGETIARGRYAAAWLPHCHGGARWIVDDVAASNDATALRATFAAAGAIVAIPRSGGEAVSALVIAVHAGSHAWGADEIAVMERVAALSWGALDHCYAATRLASLAAEHRALQVAVPGLCWTDYASERGDAGARPGSAAVDPDLTEQVAWHRNEDGRERRVLRRAAPVRADDGAIVGWCGVEIDRTEEYRRERDATFCRALGEAMHAEADPDAVVTLLGEQLAAHLRADRVSYRENDAVTGNDAVEIADLTASPDGVDAAEAARLLAGGTRALIRAAVRHAGDVVAHLEVQAREPRLWDAADAALVDAVAHRAWAALARIRTEAVVREGEEARRFVLAWSDSIRDEVAPRAILATTLDRLGRYLRVTRLFYAETDTAGTTLTLRHQWGPGEALTAAPLAVAEVLGDHATDEPLAIADLERHPALAAHAEGAAALLAAPLRRDGRLVAVLGAHHFWRRSWTVTEARLLADVADGLRAALDRAAVAARLAESEALLAAMMEHAPIGIHLKDAGGRYLHVNPELAAAIGQPVEAIAGRRPADLFPPAIARRLEAMERTAVGGDTVSEEFVTAAEDRYASFLSIAFPIDGAHRARTGGFTIDLTERKAAEAALARSRDALYQSEKLSALGSLLAGVSHELNNPLSIVVAQAVMMERQSQGSALAERAFKIRKAADRCARIVQTFLAMARQKKPERSPVELNAVAAAALELADYNLRTNGIGVTRALAPDLPRIAADADQLHQVVMNLIVNAQQAMAGVAGPRWLTICTAPGPEPDTVILEVADTGPGVPADLRRRLFEPFYTTKPQGEGTGVGLSFSQGLAEAHGGRLALMPSERGATFRLTLPIDPTLTLPRVEPGVPRVAAGERLRALIVDDEEEIAASLADFLAQEGYDCDLAVGGAAAQARLAVGGLYDLVVSDLRMPDVDGPALHAWILRERPDLATRMAFTTGDTLGAAAARFLADARRPVLEKPFMPDSVRRFLSEVEAA